MPVSCCFMPVSHTILFAFYLQPVYAVLMLFPISPNVIAAREQEEQVITAKGYDFFFEDYISFK